MGKNNKMKGMLREVNIKEWGNPGYADSIMTKPTIFVCCK